MFKMSKILSFFYCIISLPALLIIFRAYFLAKATTFGFFVVTTLFCGFLFILGLYGLFGDNSDLKSFLLDKKINFHFLLYNVGSLIFSILCFYLGIANVEDVSDFQRKLFLFGGIFFLIGPVLSITFKQKGMQKYYALPKEKRDEAEKRIIFLNKINPTFVLIVTIIAVIFYILTRR